MEYIYGSMPRKVGYRMRTASEFIWIFSQCPLGKL